MNNTAHMGEKLKTEAERLGLKPLQVAAFFGVKAPSVYDWYHHGRIHKRHYLRLVELSGKPLSWWLDLPATPLMAAEHQPNYADPDPRPRILLELFEGLPTKEQDELIQTLTQKKQHYDAVIEELLARRHAA